MGTAMKLHVTVKLPFPLLAIVKSAQLLSVNVSVAAEAGGTGARTVIE
jgi:hypothetical protein